MVKRKRKEAKALKAQKKPAQVVLHHKGELDDVRIVRADAEAKAKAEAEKLAKELKTYHLPKGKGESTRITPKMPKIS
jgi:hypothetical protein